MTLIVRAVTRTALEDRIHEDRFENYSKCSECDRLWPAASWISDDDGAEYSKCCNRRILWHIAVAETDGSGALVVKNHNRQVGHYPAGAWESWRMA